MTENPDGKRSIRDLFPALLIPLLAFGGTLAGMTLFNAGILPEIQYAAVGGFLASCLLAYLAWTRLHKDIVALSTPIYGIVFIITPIDYTGGVALQLLYAAGLTILTARLVHRFGSGTADIAAGTDLSPGPLSTYVESTRDAFTGLGPETGHAAAAVFYRFSEGEYGMAQDLAQTAATRDGIYGAVARAFTILCEHAELLDRGLPAPEIFQRFLPEDAALMARSPQGPTNPARESETEMDNALLLLFSAGWHASPADRPMLLASQGFAEKLLES